MQHRCCRRRAVSWLFWKPPSPSPPTAHSPEETVFPLHGPVGGSLGGSLGSPLTGPAGLGVGRLHVCLWQDQGGGCRVGLRAVHKVPEPHPRLVRSTFSG